MWAGFSDALVTTFRPVAYWHTAVDLYLHLALLLLVLWVLLSRKLRRTDAFCETHVVVALLLATACCLASSTAPWLFLSRCASMVDCWSSSARDSLPLAFAWIGWYVSLARGPSASPDFVSAQHAQDGRRTPRVYLVVLALVLASVLMQGRYWMLRLPILENPPTDHIERVFDILAADVWLVPAVGCAAIAFVVQLWASVRHFRELK